MKETQTQDLLSFIKWKDKGKKMLTKSVQGNINPLMPEFM